MTLTEKEKDFIHEVFFSPEEIKAHTLFFGSSVNTKTTENIALTRTNEKIREEQMNDSLKTCYLENMSDLELEIELSVIYDSLNERNISNLENIEIIKKVFMHLPHSTFCDGLKWGFTDSVVRDDIYEFIMEMDLSILKN